MTKFSYTRESEADAQDRRARRAADAREDLGGRALGCSSSAAIDAVTVAEVAREAGVSSVTVFNHFPRKEDLFLDRTDDAVELLRSAVRDRAHRRRRAGVPARDDPPSVRRPAPALRRRRPIHPLLPDRRRRRPRWSRGRREIAAELQRTLAEELERDPTFEGDATLLAAFFIAGYSTVMVETARRLIAGEPLSALVDDHRARLERLFDALRSGVAPSP